MYTIGGRDLSPYWDVRSKSSDTAVSNYVCSPVTKYTLFLSELGFYNHLYTNCRSQS